MHRPVMSQAYAFTSQAYACMYCMHCSMMSQADACSYCMVSVVWISSWIYLQRILKGEVSLYHWPPVWLVWNQLYGNWQFWFLSAKQTNPNQSNRRTTGQWYFPFSIPWYLYLHLICSIGLIMSWTNPGLDEPIPSDFERTDMMTSTLNEHCSRFWIISLKLHLHKRFVVDKNAAAATVHVLALASWAVQQTIGLFLSNV